MNAFPSAMHVHDDSKSVHRAKASMVRLVCTVFGKCDVVVMLCYKYVSKR